MGVQEGERRDGAEPVAVVQLRHHSLALGRVEDELAIYSDFLKAAKQAKEAKEAKEQESDSSQIERT